MGPKKASPYPKPRFVVWILARGPLGVELPSSEDSTLLFVGSLAVVQVESY